MTRSSLILAAAVATALAVPAHAAMESLQATVDFAFTAGDKVMPAGRYDIELGDEPGANVLSIENRDTRERVEIPYLTRINAREGDRDELVFDEIGAQRTLSEIHLADDDGFLLKDVKTEHTHQRVDLSRHPHS